MSVSIYKKLRIEEARSTAVTIQLADRSITNPAWTFEDILIHMVDFILPKKKIIILNYEVDHDISIILGRQFLNKGWTLIMGDKKFNLISMTTWNIQ